MRVEAAFRHPFPESQTASDGVDFSFLPFIPVRFRGRFI